MYFYEIDLENFSAEDDSLYSKKPRHCLPYAVIHFRYGSLETTQAILTVEESNKLTEKVNNLLIDKITHTSRIYFKPAIFLSQF